MIAGGATCISDEIGETRIGRDAASNSPNLVRDCLVQTR
jgi:hypothetical protein